MRQLMALATCLSITAAASAQQVKVEELVLPNGMTFLLVPRTDQPNSIAAGWLAKVGSVNERPGITGISHFFEHMMFKGTRTIGTSDAAADLEFMRKQDAIHDKINALVWGGQYQRYRSGEINDPWDPANDTDELRTLRAQLTKLSEDERAVIVKDEFDKVYTKEGGSGMNAFTNYDLTFFFITVPSNKFDLWAWMESDRLNDSVFREFYSERDVVHEERRLRTESTPTGIFQEQFESLFWVSSPYNWPVIGWPSDLNSYTREEAERYWNIYYRPNNLIGVVVGDFDVDAVKSTINEYFSRLKAGAAPPPPMVTTEVRQMAEQRMNAECDCQPQAQILYHAVPFRHVDSYAMEMMAAVLNGRSGRLYKAMVDGAKLASSASAQFEPRKYAGSFSFDAEVKGDATPEQLEQAWYEQLTKLQNELVGDHELQKVKNQEAANAYRRLQNNFFLLIQLGVAEGMGGWEEINDGPAKLQAVTAADIQRVAKTYFAANNRAVALYKRKAGTGAADADSDLAALSPPMQAAAKRAVGQLAAITDPAMLRMAIAQLETQMAGELPPGAPPDAKKIGEYMLKKARERLAELEQSIIGTQKPADSSK